MISADTDCVALVAAMGGYNVDCDGDLGGVFGAFSIDTTGTIVECTKPKTFCCATCSPPEPTPAPTPAPTPTPTTTEAPASGEESGAMAMVVAAIAVFSA